MNPTSKDQMTATKKCLAIAGTFLASAVFLSAATPVAVTGYQVKVFATAPANFTGPDSITRVDDDIFVSYSNGAAKDGSSGSSMVVRYNATGTVLHTYTIAGRNDGLKYNPYDHSLWALRNEDGNPKLTILNPATGGTRDLTYEVFPPVHGGGYDDVAFLNGKIFISASAPSTGDGVQNTFPSIVSAKIDDNKVKVTPVLFGNAPLWNIGTGTTGSSLQTDPDSLKVGPGGTLFLTSQADGDLIFVSNPGTKHQSAQLLHLSDGSSSQVTVDDTVFPTSPSGTILVTDSSANAIYAITSSVFQVEGAYGASDSLGAVGKIDLSTGHFTPIVAGLVSPHGALFIPTTDDRDHSEEKN